MRKYIVILIAALSLASCVNHPQVIQEKADPSWPQPIQDYPGSKFKVITVKGELYVAESFSDSQRDRIWLNDVNRYIVDQNSMICYYRSHLKEDRCKQYLNKEK